jgi:DNA-directed RNA polymerase specialized sigma24 family protein
VNHRYHPWPPEHVALLGTMTDREAAETIGVSVRAVSKYRARRRIGAALSKALIRDSMRADEVELRQLLTDTPRMTTREIADEMGWTTDTAMRRLQECRGLVRERSGRTWAWSTRAAA